MAAAAVPCLLARAPFFCPCPCRRPCPWFTSESSLIYERTAAWGSPAGGWWCWGSLASNARRWREAGCGVRRLLARLLNRSSGPLDALARSSLRQRAGAGHNHCLPAHNQDAAALPLPRRGPGVFSWFGRLVEIGLLAA